MKKIISVLMLCVLVVGMVAMSTVSVCAASPKQDIIDFIKKDLPKEYADSFLPLAENLLKQITVDAEQAEKVIACMEECKAVLNEEKGPSLHAYNKEEITFVLEQFAEACEVLNLTFTYELVQTPVHENDIVCEIYNAAGQKLADVDFDAVKKTNVPESEVNYGYVALAAALMLGAVVAVFVGKKFAADR